MSSSLDGLKTKSIATALIRRAMRETVDHSFGQMLPGVALDEPLSRNCLGALLLRSAG